MAERYKIYEKLGAGGVGAVFRAYDSQLKRWVAVKRLISATEAAQDKSIEAELRREADTLASLRNPNVVTIFDVASDEEGLFMVMELLQGEDLADVVTRGPLPYDDFKELASQTLEGLLSAHQHHILHRDIKPENIKVERLPGGRMQAKIIDFGLARAGLRARKQTEDQEGSVMGSIFYMAPEQLTRQPVDERTDLYSLGCVFYEALSGKKAFDGETMAQVIDKHIHHDLIPLHVIAPHVPPWLGAWCMRLMAQKPDDRPVGAQQAIEEFRAWEKMPAMVPMMPWMGMYPGYGQQAPQPMYIPHQTGAVPLPGTGAVPAVTGYYPVVEQPMAYAEPVMEAQPYVETAAITTPLAVAPSHPVRPGSRPVQPVRGGGQSAAAHSSSAAGKKSGLKWIYIGGGAAAAAVAAFFFMRGGDSSGPAAPPTAGPPPKITFQLQQDRPFPPVDRNLTLLHIANTGAMSSRKEADGRSARANTNESVVQWHDLAERGNDNFLRAPSSGPAQAPKLIDWPLATSGAGPKSGRRVLDFRARDGKPCALQLVDPQTQATAFPFGKDTVLGAAGMCVVAVFQADGTKLPTRLLTLSNDQGDSATLRIDTNKNLVAELKRGGESAKITSSTVSGTLAGFVTLTWSETGDAEMRVRDADGRTFAGQAKAAAPGSPLKKLLIGGITSSDGKSAAAPADQFNGFLAELMVYAGALKTDQIQLLEGRLKEFYLQSAPPQPLKTRLKTKLAWIEPRKAWKLSASHNRNELGKMVDDSQSTRWNTAQQMRGGEWVSIELPSEMEIAGLALDSQGSTNDFPRKFKVELSADGKTWNPPVVTQDGKSPLIEIVFPSPQKARHVKITQTGSAPNNWGMQELVLFKK